MLSRQRRFISDMFSYFTGDGEPQPEPEKTPDSSQSQHSHHEPSYPVKANQHRHYRSPHPEPGPEGTLTGLGWVLISLLIFPLDAGPGPYTSLLYESARNMGYNNYLSPDPESSHDTDQTPHHLRKRSSLDELPKKKPFIHLEP